MTLPVSTSGRVLLSGLSGERGCSAVSGGVVRDAVDPAAPDDADPGAGQDAHGVGVVLASAAGVVVDAGGPRAWVAAVVGEGDDRVAESFVAGPAELHRAVLAGLAGDRGDDMALCGELLGAATSRLDGTHAAATSVRRNRAVLLNALEYAVELKLIEQNPIRNLKWWAPKMSLEVDRRIVVNPRPARLLLEAVRAQHPAARAWWRSSASCTTADCGWKRPSACAAGM
jgi:hypothetical protein